MSYAQEAADWQREATTWREKYTHERARVVAVLMGVVRYNGAGDQCWTVFDCDEHRAFGRGLHTPACQAARDYCAAKP